MPRRVYSPFARSALITLALLTSLVVPPAASAAPTTVLEELNLRRGPGLGYAIVAGLPYGTVVEILGGPQAADGYRWYRVGAGRFGSGFAVGDYLDPGEGGGGSLGGDLTPATPPPPPPP